MFCHVLSSSFMFCLLFGCHRQPFGRALATLARFLCGILLIMWWFVVLWLCVVCTAVRRALCLRRPRRRVRCSGQAVPCLLLRRFQQAVLVYMRSCWFMLMMINNANVGSCWCMLIHAHADARSCTWCIWFHVMLEVCWPLSFSKDVEGPWNRVAVWAWDFDIG